MPEPSVPDGGASPFRTEIQRPHTWQRVIQVEIEREHFDRAYAANLQAARREAIRPGFRKGRVPAAVVEQELGKELRDQTLEQIVPEAYKAAMVEHAIAPVDDPVVGDLKLEPGAPITFRITVEVRPEVTARDYTGLALRRREATVADADFEEVLRRLRLSHAVYERVERPAAAEDQVLLCIDTLDDEGRPAADRRVEDYEFELGAPGNIAAFETALTGATAGQTREVTVTYAADHFAPDLRGRTVRYRLEVREVRQRLLPELDDAFAARLKPGQTMLELRQLIRADLQRQEEALVRRELEEQIIDRLLERHDVELPPSLIAQYVAAGLDELHARNQQRGRPNTPEEDEHYRQMTQPVATRVLRGMFIMEAIRKQEGIAASPAEVEARLAEIAHDNGFDLERFRDYAVRQGEIGRIAHALEERKTYDFLLERAAIETAAAAGA